MAILGLTKELYFTTSTVIDRMDVFYNEKLNYIHMNPVKQEIVEKPEDYIYSSVRNYNGQKGMIDVIVQP